MLPVEIAVDNGVHLWLMSRSARAAEGDSDADRGYKRAFDRRSNAFTSLAGATQLASKCAEKFSTFLVV